MIIDLILDRKDGLAYNPCDFYRDVMEYEMIFDFDRTISYAMDDLENVDVQTALAVYIIKNEYNPQLIEYIYSVNWLLPDFNFEL